jgi:hypothetical protein
MWRCNNVSGQSLERRKTVDAGFAAIQGNKAGGNLGDGVFGVIGRSRICFVFLPLIHTARISKGATGVSGRVSIGGGKKSG